jgi:hypothetical protein
MTIPQLRRAFEDLEKRTQYIVKQKAKANRVEEFQKVWKDIFSRPVSVEAAREYIEYHERKLLKGGFSQQGGAAPLDWTLGPGVSSPHGSFLNYLSSSLASFGNDTNNDSFRAQCNKEDPTPILPPTLGSNLVGGKRRSGHRTLGATRRKQKGGMARLITGMASPPSIANDISVSLRGQSIQSPSPSAVDNPNVTSTRIPIPSITTSIANTLY